MVKAQGKFEKQTEEEYKAPSPYPDLRYGPKISSTNY